jgi:hypothetical protein
MSKQRLFKQHNAFGPALMLQALGKAIIGLVLLASLIMWPFVWAVRAWSKRRLARDSTSEEPLEGAAIPMAPFVNPHLHTPQATPHATRPIGKHSHAKPYVKRKK